MQLNANVMTGHANYTAFNEIEMKRYDNLTIAAYIVTTTHANEIETTGYASIDTDNEVESDNTHLEQVPLNVSSIQQNSKWQ